MNEGYKIPETPKQEKPPEIRIPTRDPYSGKEQERLLSLIPDSVVKIPEQMTGRERNDAFEKAYAAIVGNEKLEQLAIRGIKGDLSAFSARTNKITELCLSLSDEEIDSIVRKFNEVLRSKSQYYATQYNLNNEELDFLKNGMRVVRERREDIFNSIGVKSVTRFVRSRLKLHSVKPETVPAFYFENYLDSWHNIDLIEMFERGDGLVMNLIQIKSRDYTTEEIAKNTEIHKAWVDGYAVDLNAYEKSFEAEPEDSDRYKEFFGEVSHVEDLLVDMLTGEEVSMEILFEKMGLKGVPNVERAWILSTYVGAIKEAFAHVEDVGLTEEQLSRIHGIIEDIEAKLASLLAKKKDLKGISEIHSICTVAERQVSDVVIFRGEDGNRKAINVKN